MDKKLLNTAIFFNIVFWILFFILVIDQGLIFSQFTTFNVVLILLANAILLTCSKYLVSAFELVLKVTSRIGSLIFGIISTLVFYLILTPIALLKRIFGKPLLKVKISDEVTSYYEKWEAAGDIEKQY
jgi:hypothetical protein